jgi:hypothetical protein
MVIPGCENGGSNSKGKGSGSRSTSSAMDRNAYLFGTILLPISAVWALL